MKKLLFLLILNLLLNIKLVWADVCFYVSSQAAQKSVQFLKKNSEIINYCELCSNSEAQSEIIQNVSFKQVPKSDYYVLSINNNEKDIAYVYVKTNDNNYENLAYIVGCTDAKKIKYHNSDPFFLL